MFCLTGLVPTEKVPSMFYNESRSETIHNILTLLERHAPKDLSNRDGVKHTPLLHKTEPPMTLAEAKRVADAAKAKGLLQKPPTPKAQRYRHTMKNVYRYRELRTQGLRIKDIAVEMNMPYVSAIALAKVSASLLRKRIA